MFELANILIGIYKTFDITKCLTYNPEKVDKKEVVQDNVKDDIKTENENKENMRVNN